METPNVKRLQRFLEAVVAKSTAADDQIILRTTTPGAPALTLGDIKLTLDELLELEKLSNMFVKCKELSHTVKQRIEKYCV